MLHEKKKLRTSFKTKRQRRESEKAEKRIEKKKEEENAPGSAPPSQLPLPSPHRPPSPSPATAAAGRGRSPPNSILTLWNTESASAEYGASDVGISKRAGTAAECAATRWRTSLAALCVMRTTPMSLRERVNWRKVASSFGTGVSVVVGECWSRRSGRGRGRGQGQGGKRARGREGQGSGRKESEGESDEAAGKGAREARPKPKMTHCP